MMADVTVEVETVCANCNIGGKGLQLDHSAIKVLQPIGCMGRDLAFSLRCSHIQIQHTLTLKSLL